MTLYSLASSSSGNCYIYDFDSTKILIDIGISYKQFCNKIQETDLEISSIDAVFITHEHGDHVKGLEVFCKKHDIPVYITAGTNSALKFDVENKNEIISDELYKVGDVEVEVIKTSHDTEHSVCFLMRYNNRSYGHVTDTGYMSMKMQKKFHGLDFYLMESNYEEQALLTNKAYPQMIKKRISSDKGHLSNVQTNNFLKNYTTSQTKTVCFAHLSDKNNDPELVEIINKSLAVPSKVVLKKDEVVTVTCK